MTRALPALRKKECVLSLKNVVTAFAAMNLSDMLPASCHAHELMSASNLECERDLFVTLERLKMRAFTNESIYLEAAQSVLVDRLQHAMKAVSRSREDGLKARRAANLRVALEVNMLSQCLERHFRSKYGPKSRKLTEWLQSRLAAASPELVDLAWVLGRFPNSDKLLTIMTLLIDRDILLVTLPRKSSSDNTTEVDAANLHLPLLRGILNVSKCMGARDLCFRTTNADKLRGDFTGPMVTATRARRAEARMFHGYASDLEHLCGRFFNDFHTALATRPACLRRIFVQEIYKQLERQAIQTSDGLTKKLFLEEKLLERIKAVFNGRPVENFNPDASVINTFVRSGVGGVGGLTTAASPRRRWNVRFDLT